MNSFTKGQFFTLIFTAGVFFVFSSGCASNFSELVGVLICAALNALIFGICIIASKNKTTNTFSNAVLLTVEIFAGAGCIASFFNAENNADFGIGHEIWGAILLGGAVIYCASLGLRAAARCSSLIFGATLVAVFLLCIGAFSKLDFSDFSFDFSLKNAVFFGINSFSSSCIIAVSTALIMRKSTDVTSFPAMSAIVSLALADILLSVLAIAVSSDTPTFFELARLAQPFSVQSGEWIYIVIYGLLSVLCLSLIVHLASQCLKELFPKAKFCTIICAALVFVCAALMPYFNVKTKTILLSSNLIAPVSCIFLSKKNKIKKHES